MNTKDLKTKRGFKLVEVLVAASLFVVIGIIMLAFFFQGSSIWQLTVQQSNLRSVGSNAMGNMLQELRNATRTSSRIPSPNLSIPAKPNNNSITFYVPRDVDGNGYVFDTLGSTEWDTAKPIQYQYVSASKRLQRSASGNVTVLAVDVTSIEFEDKSINASLQSNELKVILKLTRLTAQKRTVTVNLTSIVKLRNQ